MTRLDKAMVEAMERRINKEGAEDIGDDELLWYLVNVDEWTEEAKKAMTALAEVYGLEVVNYVNNWPEETEELTCEMMSEIASKVEDVPEEWGFDYNSLFDDIQDKADEIWNASEEV